MSSYIDKYGDTIYLERCLAKPIECYKYHTIDSKFGLIDRFNKGFYPLHREDGPADEWPADEWTNGYKAWFYHGEQIHCKDNEEFLKIIKMKAFL